MPSRPCSDCAAPVVVGNRGNGKCSNCYGGGRTGTIINDITGSDRSCRKCGGTGRCPACGGHGVVSAEAVRPNAHAELNPFDDKEAIRLVCPHCGDTDWFEWRFLGKLEDPVCGHEWYADSAVYAGKQVRASFQMGKKLVKYFNHGVSGEGAFIAKALGGFTGMVFGLAFRLPYGLILIPVQALVKRNARARGNSDKKYSVAAGQ